MYRLLLSFKVLFNYSIGAQTIAITTHYKIRNFIV